jgi:hypothetical protein
MPSIDPVALTYELPDRTVISRSETERVVARSDKSIVKAPNNSAVFRASVEQWNAPSAVNKATL